MCVSRKHNEQKSITLLDQAVRTHLASIQNLPPGFEFYIQYNPDFVFEMVREYMLHVGTEPRQSWSAFCVFFFGVNVLFFSFFHSFSSSHLLVCAVVAWVVWVFVCRMGRILYHWSLMFVM